MYFDSLNPKKIFFTKSSRAPNPNRTKAHPTPKLASIASSTSKSHLTLTSKKCKNGQARLLREVFGFVKCAAFSGKVRTPYRGGSPLQKRIAHARHGLPFDKFRTGCPSKAWVTL